MGDGAGGVVRERTVRRLRRCTAAYSSACLPHQAAHELNVSASKATARAARSTHVEHRNKRRGCRALRAFSPARNVFSTVFPALTVRHRRWAQFPVAVPRKVRRNVTGSVCSAHDLKGSGGSLSEASGAHPKSGASASCARRRSPCRASREEILHTYYASCSRSFTAPNAARTKLVVISLYHCTFPTDTKIDAPSTR